jgi:uncharacterized iron-regulated membrane protein
MDPKKPPPLPRQLEYQSKRRWSDMSAEERGERIGHLVHKGAWLVLLGVVIFMLVQIAGCFLSMAKSGY